MGLDISLVAYAIGAVCQVTGIFTREARFYILGGTLLILATVFLVGESISAGSFGVPHIALCGATYVVLIAPVKLAPYTRL